MSSYQQLVDEIGGGSWLGESPALPLPPELELQALWFSGAFGRDFSDTAGRPVRIVQFGEWNRGAGPDFLHAVVDLDGDVREGPVELDIDPHDWEAHGHGADENFNATVLHVVFVDRPTAFTRTSEHRQVPQVRMPAALTQQALARPSREVAIARPGRCVHPLAGLPAAALHSLLRQSAIHRAQLKAARFLRTAEAHGRDTALYQAVAETLGYRANTLPMRLLAQRMPLHAVRADPEAIHPLIFGAAGFLAPDLHESAPPDTRDYLREQWDIWWKHRARWESEHPIPWKMHGQRPANHPHRRVAALAVLAHQWSAFRRLALARPFRPKPLLDFLTGLGDSFWSHRHTLSSAPSKRPIAIFGKSRGLELLANHLVPLAMHESPAFDFEAYLRLPATPPNEKVRRCAIRLFGSEAAAAPWLKKSAYHQALLQIYHDFCLEDLSDCHACPFPEQLSQWR